MRQMTRTSATRPRWVRATLWTCTYRTCARAHRTARARRGSKDTCAMLARRDLSVASCSESCRLDFCEWSRQQFNSLCLAVPMTLTQGSLSLWRPSTPLGDQATQPDQSAPRFLYDVSNGYRHGRVFGLRTQHFRAASFRDGLELLGAEATNELAAGLANEVPHARFERFLVAGADLASSYYCMHHCTHDSSLSLSLSVSLRLSPSLFRSPSLYHAHALPPPPTFFLRLTPFPCPLLTLSLAMACYTC
jgi:hypothetical protein